MISSEKNSVTTLNNEMKMNEIGSYDSISLVLTQTGLNLFTQLNIAFLPFEYISKAESVIVFEYKLQSDELITMTSKLLNGPDSPPVTVHPQMDIS